MVSPNSFECRPVSIVPSDALSDSEQLLTMSCEDVVDLKAGVESKRTDHMPDASECEARVSFRAAPSALMQGLAVLAELKTHSRRLVIKCLVHKGDVLLSTLSGFDEIGQIYSEVLVRQGEHGGLSDVLEQMDCQQYQHRNDRVVSGEFVVVRRLVSSFQTRSKGLGISTSALIAVSLCWALTFTADSRLVGAATDLAPEMDHFRRYVRERGILMRAYMEIVKGRLDNIHRM